MFKKKAKQAEDAPVEPCRIPLLGNSDTRYYGCSDVRGVRSPYYSLTANLAQKIKGIIEYEDELLDILEKSPEFHELKRQQLQRQLDVKLNESSALSQEIIKLAKAVRS